MSDAENTMIGDIDLLPAGVVYVNHTGIITAMNAPMRKWLGDFDCVGQPFSEIFSGAGRIFNLTHIQPSLQHSAQVEEMFVQLKCKNGTLISLVLNAKRYSTLDVYVFTPMGKRQHFEAEIINARKQAEKAAIDSTEAYAALQQMQAELEQSNRDLETLASTDSLTGIANRRHFQDVLKQQISLFERYQQPLSLVVFDVDHFKAINDAAGHDVGDQTLQRLAEVVSNCVRQGDTLARTGGEEFAVIMVNCDLDTAFNAAERIRTTIENGSFPYKGITVSAGVAAFTENESVQSFYMRADQALYAAKRNGRNRTEIAG